MLGGSYDATTDRWGWSALLKVGWNAGAPEEFGRLRRSLVFVGSLDDFGVLGEALGGTPDWHGEHDEATGLWWFRDESLGNIFVHGCHPNVAQRGHSTEEALDRTVLLARNLLPRFS